MKETRKAISDESIFNSLEQWKMFIRLQIANQTNHPIHLILYSSSALRTHVKRFSDVHENQPQRIIQFRITKNYEVIYFFNDKEYRFKTLNIEQYIRYEERNEKFKKIIKRK